MRDRWYGDDRDVVKWSALIHLAQREAVSKVLHVAMYRVDSPPAPLTTAYGRVDLPPAVFRHFRDLNDVQRLAEATGLAIEVVKEPFVNRASYFSSICDRVRAQNMPVIVFLDPDVGLASELSGLDHVTSTEVAAVFASLHPGDHLVCYQHARRQKDWRGRARRAFANAPGVPSFDVEVLRSELARDVLLLAVKRPL
ncbi:MAG: hypothetical protein VX453_07925 [Acidobacteriota bacterium]|nr:hypothetical protein [Acidobacteriota bacterium]